MPLRLTSTSLSSEWQVHTQTRRPPALSGRHPVVSRVTVAKQLWCRASWARNVWCSWGVKLARNKFMTANRNLPDLTAKKPTSDIRAGVAAHLFIHAAPGRQRSHQRHVRDGESKSMWCLVMDVSSYRKQFFQFHRAPPSSRLRVASEGSAAELSVYKHLWEATTSLAPPETPWLVALAKVSSVGLD